jgi:hypothetical protein
VYVAFWIGLLYFAMVAYAADKGMLPPGWYLCAVAGAEIALCITGLRRLLPRVMHRWIAPAGVFLFSVLDLYTMNAIAIPYYTGMTRHGANGSLAALHFGDFQAVGFREAFARLTIFKPISMEWLIVLWSGYLAATVALVFISLKTESEMSG